ncbi:MAG: TonB-dependent receptor plug domain-containing protein [Bacteroidota bacterium]|nr:TonB-dependent receptor plug domain-containing protein [Bacteroidota bacterium]
MTRNINYCVFQIQTLKALSAIFVMLISLQVVAQNNNDSTPQVWSSAKCLQPITEAASTVEIITAEDIENSGFTNLGDVFRMVVGMDVRESDAMQHVIGIRGFCDAAHVQFLIDGQPVYFNSTNYVMVDWLPIDLEEIERIEIVKGSVSVLYPGNAFSGLVNIITKRPEDLKHVQANAVYGGYNTLRTNIITGGKAGKVNYSIAGGFKMGDSWEKNDYWPDADNYASKYAAVKMNVKLSDSDHLDIHARYSDAENVFSRSSNPKTTLFSINYSVTDRWHFRYSHYFQQRPIEMSYDSYTYQIDDKGYDLELIRYFRFGKHNLTAGINGRFTGNDLKIIDGSFYYSNTDTDYEESFNAFMQSVYIDDRWHLSPKLLLNLSGNMLHYSDQGLLGTYRVALIFNPNPKNNLRLTIAKGHLLPSLFHKYSQGKVAVPIGNEDIEAEKYRSAELSYSFTANSAFKLKFSAFWGVSENYILSTFPSANMNNNANPSGIEFSIKGKPFKIFELRLNYTLFHENPVWGFDSYNKDKLNFSTKLKLWKFTLYNEFHYVDKSWGLFPTSNPYFYKPYPYSYSSPELLEAYYAIHSNLVFRLNDHLRVNFAAYNLSNNIHKESKEQNTSWGSIYKTDKIGRRYTVGLSVRF